MRPEAVDLLACVFCGSPVHTDGMMLTCRSRHSFDVARQGYVSMLAGDAHTGTADSAAMVDARAAFFDTGHFSPLSSAIAHAAVHAAEGVAGCVVDAGGGTGHHLAAALAELPGRSGVVLDLSKHAARRAARMDPRIASVACDTWRRLPVRDGAAAVVLDVFAPRNPVEFQRILAKGGGLVVVTPTAGHLREIIGPLGLVTVDERKGERLEDALHGLFEPVDESRVEYPIEPRPDEIIALASMGPSAHHVSEQELAARVANLPERVSVTISARVARYRAR
jgi:23S rRNA (guanine745-N1)-methyltransferase